MKSAENWSSAAKCGGLHLWSLPELVSPLPQTRWEHFPGADGCHESHGLGRLPGERVLLANHMNRDSLPATGGRPLTLIVPSPYGQQSAKAIEQFEFFPLDL